MPDPLFKDHFSGHASTYAAFRPRYPNDLFCWLARLSRARSMAWDSATGNGQAAVALSEHFTEVVATDASAKQIDNAVTRPNIRYLVEAAERSSLEDQSVDLATVAQAYHWYDHKRFHHELDRVIKSGGIFASWAYPLARVNTAVDRIAFDLYDRLGDYWPEERKYIERGYRDFEMPWPELTPPDFEMRASWTVQQFIGYLNTWSSVQRFIKRKSSNPVEAITDNLVRAWGTRTAHVVQWPLILRACRKP